MPILNSLADRQRATLDAVDEGFAEPIRLSFLKNGAADPDRPRIDIMAPLRVGGGNETNLAGGFAQDWRSRLAAGKALLSIDVGKYEGPPLRVGDRVRALSRPSRPWFEVLRVDDRGENRLVLDLGEA